MVPESEVDHALEQITGRYDDDTAFKSALEENTLDVDSLREAVQQGLRVEAVLDFVCRDVEPVDETEATLFYYLHRDRFMQPERRTARHILVTINEELSENSRDSANARILQIAKRLQKQPKRFEEQGRKDDNPETFSKRLEKYYEDTAPLVPIYAERSILTEVDGMASIEEVATQIDAALKETA